MAASILLIDDSPGECELFRLALSRTESRDTLDIVHDSRAALAHLRDRTGSAEPTLILLDLKLRGESGLDLLTQLKQDPQARHIPIIILSSSDSVSDIRACYQAGANGYVVKPSRFEDLITLAQHIRQFWIEHNCTLRMSTAC